MSANWRTIAELTGLGAVVISLLLVVYELRQTQVSINVAAYQQLIDGISEFNLATMESPELRAARDKLQSGEALSGTEASVLNAFLYLAYRNGDLAHFQYEQGIIAEDRLRSGLGLLVNLLEYPIVQAHWRAAQPGFVDSYRDYVNRLIEDVSKDQATQAPGARLLMEWSNRSDQN